MTWRVPLVEIPVADEDVEAVLDTLRSGWLTMGPVTERFERAFADHVGVEHAVAVSSGTAALHLACLAAGVGPGDEVLVPDLSFVACAHAPRQAGATPVLCDATAPLEPGMSAEDAAARTTPYTKALLCVHEFGYAADLPALEELCAERGLVLIEDCAQALGARDREGRKVGSVGRFGCFSFFSKKQLAVGEGGMVVTADADAAERLRSLRSHAMTTLTWERHRGHAEGYDVTEVGFNYRIDEPRSALGLSRLPRVDDDVADRRRVVRAYRRLLEGSEGLEIPFDNEAVERAAHFAFPVLAPDRERRDALREALHERGVQTTWYPAIHTLSEYRSPQPGRPLDVAADLADRHFTLPVFAGLSAERVGLVVEALEGSRASLE